MEASDRSGGVGSVFSMYHVCRESYPVPDTTTTTYQLYDRRPLFGHDSCRVKQVLMRQIPSGVQWPLQDALSLSLSVCLCLCLSVSVFVCLSLSVYADLTRHGHDTTRHDTTRHDTAQHKTTRPHLSDRSFLIPHSSFQRDKSQLPLITKVIIISHLGSPNRTRPCLH
ncbi:hypothetical protein K504DRAFT_67861 [Pleomassaria siparia CBS 279.74]|uniref:Uncharacterized protein n=1 Tax=Pleomassaria siparia CBS 279.74 TaxID=1314801 RepID=A0A6G1K2T9_9PLEO|nr:hypothetical protein K504DRAFT_67861 [Pleomassaria siparia CBS 279.74]